MNQFNRSLLCAVVVTGCQMLASETIWADHGPGTSGGGTSVQSGETLKPKQWSLDLRLDYTEFDNVSDGEIVSKATKAGGFDVLDRSFLQTWSVSYGVIETFQVALSLGYYIADNAREGEFDPGTGDTEILTFDPDGLTDLWLTGKYRVCKGRGGSVAVFGGVKFPTGRDRVKNSEGEFVEPSATAGTGAFDGMFGAAYSVWLTSHATLDASAQYIVRGEAHDFQLGDRVDTGVAVAYRLTEFIKTYPQPSVFAEATVRYLFQSEDDGERDPNTGGTVLFLSPGARVAFTPNVVFTVSPQFPVLQDLRGRQLATQFKVVAGVTLTF